MKNAHCPSCGEVGGTVGTTCHNCGGRGIITATEPAPDWDEFDQWADHPDYPAEDWRYEVNEGDTRQSYVAWVKSCLEQKDEQ